MGDRHLRRATWISLAAGQRASLCAWLLLGAGCGGAISAGSATSGSATSSGATSASASASGASSTGGGAGSSAAASSGNTSSSGNNSGTANGTTGSGTGGVDAGPPQPAGSPCREDPGCLSGSCGANGICCARACAFSAGACAAACAVGSGVCSYPDAGQVCAPSYCENGGYLAPSTCDGQGNCLAPALSTCRGLACADAQTCKTSCLSDSDCVAGVFCDRPDGGPGSCAGNLPNGSGCSEPGNCASGACLGHHCCVASCPAVDPVCGATSCDSQGACGPVTAAGATCFPAGCDGVNFRPVSSCDGLGSCAIQAASSCSPYSCGGSGCFSSCQTDVDCAPNLPNSYCNGQLCCTLSQGLNIDGAAGVDSPCCGTPQGQTPCQTLTYALQQLDAYNRAHTTQPVTGIVLTAQLSDGTADWQPANGETWPVQLSYGVTLLAPGIYFAADSDAGALFRIALYPGETNPSTVSIEGSVSASNPVTLGSDSLGRQTATSAAVEVDGPQTLDLTEAAVYSPRCVGARDGGGCAGTAIWVDNGTLNLGTDLSQTLGPVNVGGPLPNAGAVDGGATGIRCSGADGGIFDNGLANGSGFSVQGMGRADIELLAGCLMNLNAGDQLGVAPQRPGINQCATKIDSLGLRMEGPSTALFNATYGFPNQPPQQISCQDQYGIQLLADATGVGPQVSVGYGLTVANCGCWAVDVQAGQLNLNGAITEYNRSGVLQEGGGLATLNETTLACNSHLERSLTCRTGAAINLLDLSSAPVATSSFNYFAIAADAAGSTQRWQCPSAALTGCSCFGLQCSDAGTPPEGAPVVYLQSDTNVPPVPAAAGTSTPVTCN